MERERMVVFKKPGVLAKRGQVARPLIDRRQQDELWDNPLPPQGLIPKKRLLWSKVS